MKNTNQNIGINNSNSMEPIIGERGWICPKCGRVLAPWMSECPCYKERTTTTANLPSTGTPFLKDSYTICSGETIRDIALAPQNNGENRSCNEK